MKKLLIILFLLNNFFISAQTKFAINAGINIANMKEKYDGANHLSSFIPRLQIGTILKIPINENWLLYTGLYYSGKGSKYGITYPSMKKDSIRTHLNYIELPVQIMYKFSEDKSNNFLLGGGLYAGYGFNGEILYKGSPRLTETHLHRKKGYYKRIEFGFNLSTLYQINNKYGIKLAYSQSLLTIGKDKLDKTKNIVFNFSLFHFFGKEK